MVSNRTIFTSLANTQQSIGRLIYDKADGSFYFDWNMVFMQTMFEQGLVISLARILMAAIDAVLKGYQQWKAETEKRIVGVPAIPGLKKGD